LLGELALCALSLLGQRAVSAQVGAGYQARTKSQPPAGPRGGGRCMNCSGDITRGVVPSRQGVFSVSTTWPVALHCTRSLEIAGRVM
jgi:hypothetical protein